MKCSVESCTRPVGRRLTSLCCECAHEGVKANEAEYRQVTRASQRWEREGGPPSGSPISGGSHPKARALPSRPGAQFRGNCATGGAR